MDIKLSKSLTQKLWTFFITLFAAVLGTYLTMAFNLRAAHQQRMEDALMDVAYNPDIASLKLTPYEIMMRNSLIHEKFALLASGDFLKEAAATEDAAKSCDTNAHSEECENKNAEIAWLEREAVGSSIDSSDKPAFLRIVRKEQDRQMQLIDSLQGHQFVLIFPDDLGQLNGEDIPAIHGRQVPSDFASRFPVFKYVILVQLFDDAESQMKKNTPLVIPPLLADAKSGAKQPLPTSASV